MQKDHSFERQLKNFENESNAIASYIYAEMAIQHAASESPELLSRMNMTPTFWHACYAAFQSAAYIAIARVFDCGSRYNIEELLTSVETEILLFQRPALEKRKSDAVQGDLSWLKGYLDQAHYLTLDDVARLRRTVAKYRGIYKKAVMPVRHQYLAHRYEHDETKIQALYENGKVNEMWRLSTYLVKLHLALRELYLNGRKPVLRPSRYSVRSMYNTDANRTGAHEYIVRDVRKLMQFLETATPNLISRRTGSGSP